jgi:hypothetical protein
MVAAGATSARQLPPTGALGTVRFCRVSDRGLGDAALAMAGSDVVLEVDPSATGIALLGSRATLVVDHDGWRLFAPTAL